MTKNVLFFVHGVGRHAKGWSTQAGGPIDSLNKVARQYQCFKDLELSKLVDLVEIRYDDIFDQHLDQWATLAQSLKPVAGGSQIAGKITDLLSNVNDDRNLFAKYGGDVLLYSGFELIAKRVRLRVNAIISKKITETLAKAKTQAGPNPEFGIIGHSLGTTIVHDSLDQLARNQWLPAADLSAGDIKLTQAEKDHLSSLGRRNTNPFSPDVFTWDSVYMVSNTSRLLHQTKKEPYKSLIQPGKAVRYYVNIDHELDPISKVKRFRIPSDWDRSRARLIEVDHIHQANIHGYGHYLKHPKVHRPIFRLLFPEFTASCNDHAKLLATSFPQYAGQFDVAAKRNALKKQAKSMIETYKNAGLAKFREEFEEFTKKIGSIV